MISKNILFPAVFVVVFGSAAVFGVSRVQAQADSPVTTLVDRITRKFGLDKTQVQSVFDEFHKERRQDRLTNLVENGKITEAQKQAILAKQEELRKAYSAEAFANLTVQERRTKIQEMHTAMQSWAESQNIDVTHFGFGFRGKGHMGR